MFNTRSARLAWDLYYLPVNNAPIIELTSPTLTFTSFSPSTVIKSTRVIVPFITVNDWDVLETFYGQLTVNVSVTTGLLNIDKPPTAATLLGGSTSLSKSMSLTGMPKVLNAALAQLYYVVPMNTCNTDTIAIWVTDNGFIGAGGPLTATSAIAVTVTCAATAI